MLSYMMRGNNDEGTVDYFPLLITYPRDFVGRPERRRPLGSPRHIQENDIKMAGLIWLRIGTGGGLVNAVMKFRVP